jgi:hypothetical protein
MRGSKLGGASANVSGDGRAGMHEGGSMSRTTIHARSAGTTVRSGSRTAVGVRTAHSGGAVYIKRKSVRAYAYSEPSTTVIRKKKRYVTHHEPSSAVVVHRRHAGVAVDSGVSSRTSTRTSTRTSVRTQSGGTAVRGSGSSQTVGGGANIRQRSSGPGNIGASSSPQGQSGAAQGGQTTGRSGTSGGGQMPANR